MKTGVFAFVVFAGVVALSSPGFGGQPADAPDQFQAPVGANRVAGELLVRFAPDAVGASAESLAAEYGLKIEECIATINLCKVTILDGTSELDAAQRIEQDEKVVYAEPNYIDQVLEDPQEAVPLTDGSGDEFSIIPSDPLYSQQWHYPLITVPTAWSRFAGSTSTVIAVVDTGVRFTHPDLAGRLSTHGYDFIDNDTNPTDPGTEKGGHGTHTTGTIAAATNNGVGVAGMTWKSIVLPIRTMGLGGGTHFQFSQGFRYAAGLLAAPDPVNPTPAQVINYSGGGVDSKTKRDAVAAVNAAGVVMAVSSGNDNGAVGYPAAYSADYSHLICVGATNYGNGSPARAWYSNYGSQMNVVAPGGDTGVDSDGDGHPDGVLSTAWNFSSNTPTYVFWQGTSMAAPHVAGLAALMVGFGCPPAKVRTVLQNTATDLGAAGFDIYNGWGLINAQAALAAIPGPAPSGLFAKGISSSQIVVNWTDNSIGETSYRLERKTGSCGSSKVWSLVATLAANTTNYTNSFLLANTVYSYRVKGANATMSSVYSNCTSATTGPAGTPASPKGLTATSLSTSTVKLNWPNSSTTENNFKVYRKLGSGAWSLRHTTTGPNVLSFSDTAAPGNTATTTYSYYVTACNGSGCSNGSYSAVVPYAPTSATAAKGVTAGSISLSWLDRSIIETNFLVERKPGSCSSIGTWTLIRTLPAGSRAVIDSRLTSGSAYAYRVRALVKSQGMPNTYGYSSYSNCVAQTAP